MIYFEDEDYETVLFEEKFPTCIPITVEQKIGEEVKITAYRRVEKIARGFEYLFWENPFSDNAKKWLVDALDPIVKTWEYEPSPYRFEHMLNFEISSPHMINKDVILNNTVKITDDEGYINRTTYKFECECEDDDAYFVTDLGGEIVSIASINSYPEGSNIREIAVETAVDFRKKGYATSNTAALALYLAQRGYIVTYECSNVNTASQKTAAKVGFDRVGTTYCYVCYNNL